MITTLKAEARSLWDKSAAVIGNEENRINRIIKVLLIKMLYFWYKFPEENLVDKCLRF